ncbi:MAG: nicotinate-nucleotide adenylyltransferase [Gammaproteobacteria bacterium]|nr:nicotinate-nucleotide adenylyltransferase [Gammaproteobacteria bacterium]
MNNSTKAIGIFGGTFDPIHFGHLRTALELYERLPLQEVRFLPCQQPVHKSATGADVNNRLAMLKLAIANQPGFTLDTRELERSSPSYMYETLTSIRNEVGNTPLCLICSMDAFINFTSWYRWEAIPELAHLVVATRANHAKPLSSLLDSFFASRTIHDPQSLLTQAAGYLLFIETTPLTISSTAIRQIIKNNLSPSYLLPEKVETYIEKQHLYK